MNTIPKITTPKSSHSNRRISPGHHSKFHSNDQHSISLDHKLKIPDSSTSKMRSFSLESPSSNDSRVITDSIPLDKLSQNTRTTSTTLGTTNTIMATLGTANPVGMSRSSSYSSMNSSQTNQSVNQQSSSSSQLAPPSINTDSIERRKKIIVAARFRPQLAAELAEGGENIVRYAAGDTVILKQKKDGRETTYTFDKVFSENASQQDVFNFCGTPAIEDLFDGLNGVIFSYGQTGAGKTWSVFGKFDTDVKNRKNALEPITEGNTSALKMPDERGIGPRVVSRIFERIHQETRELSQQLKFSVKISFYEIYLEKVYDLLGKDTSNPFANPTNDPLHVKMDSMTGGFYVQGLSQFKCHSVSEVMRFIILGNMRKKTASTSMNRDSSRSHTILSLTLSKYNVSTASVIESTLNIVDLAGNENTDRSNATGERMKEAKAINKSLSTLGKCIFFLTQNKRSIPIRESKLTKLLSDALQGRARTILLINCSPSSVNEFGTLSTLRFGVSAKNIKPRKSISLTPSKTSQVEILRKKLREAEERILYLEGRCHNLRQNVRFSTNEPPNARDMNQLNNTLAQEVSKWKQQVMTFEDEIEDYKFDLKREEAKNQLLTKKFQMKEAMLRKQIEILDAKSAEYEQELQKINSKRYFGQSSTYDKGIVENLHHTISLLKYDFELLKIECKSLVQEHRLSFHDAQESLLIHSTSRSQKLEKENEALRRGIEELLRNRNEDLSSSVAKELKSLLMNNSSEDTTDSTIDDFQDFTNDFIDEHDAFYISSDDDEDFIDSINISTELCGTVQLLHLDSEDSEPEWKSRWLVLDAKDKILRCYKSMKSPIAREIPLSDVKSMQHSIDEETITLTLRTGEDVTFRICQIYTTWLSSIEKYLKSTNNETSKNTI